MPIVPPQIVGGATTAAGVTSSDTITLPRPSGVQAGDVLVAVLRTNGSTSPTDFALTGWTRRGAPFVPNDAAGRVQGLYTHVITDLGSEPSSYVFKKSVADTRWDGAMFALRGVDLAALVTGAAAGFTATANPAISTHTFATDTSDPQLLIYAWGAEIVSPAASEPVTVPAGSTQVALVPSSAGTGNTRTTLWVGAEAFASTNVPSKTLTWAVTAPGLTAAGPSALAVAFRGTDGVVPPTESDVKFKLRRGTSAQWAAANPVLAEGEPGVDLTKRELKIGDGASEWDDLPGISGGSNVLVVANINAIPPGTPAGTIVFQGD